MTQPSVTPDYALVVHPSYAHKEPLTTGPTRLSDLPVELLTLVAYNLSAARDLCAFQQASCLLRSVSKGDRLWKRLCQRDFGTPPEFVEACGMSWKEAYRLQRQVLYNMMAPTSSEFGRLNLGSSPAIVLQVR